MRRCAYHVELSRCRCVVTGKIYFLGSLRDVQAILISHLEFLSVSHNPAAAADVENADLAALQEIVCAEILPAVNSLIYGNSLCGRHTS